jgi:enoyl-CoA hydratase/carnithine racemase
MADTADDISLWQAWKQWETLKLETNQAFPEIGLLTLNRPDKLNAINVAMMDDLNACLAFLDHAFDCRVLILCGTGRVFCSGADLTTGLEGETRFDWTRFPDKVKTFWQMQHELSFVMAKLRRIPQPVIAAVHGAAVGAGMALANASDLVVASRGTRFINAFIKIGVSGADCGSSYYLPRLLSLHRSAELLYSGRDLTAEEAHAWGYVNFLVDQHEEAVPRAVRFAADFMLTRSPLGLRLTKEALNNNVDAGSLEAALDLENRNQVLSAQAQDAMEGVIAFFEKRRPKYGAR